MSAKKADRWETEVARRLVGKYLLRVMRNQLGIHYVKPWVWDVWRLKVNQWEGEKMLASGYAAKEWQAKLYARRAMEKHAGRGRK